MHQSSMKRMAWFVDNFLSTKEDLRILDVGSCDVNGSYKKLFSKWSGYIGLDMASGANVDICVKNPYKWSEVVTDSFDVVISGQTLEHSPYFWLLFGEMVRAAKKNGLICIVVPRGFHVHRYPVDCWRFLADGMTALCDYYQLQVLHASTNAAPNWSHLKWFSKNNADTLLIAKKTYSGVPLPVTEPTFDLSIYQKDYKGENWFEFPVDGSLGIYLFHVVKRLFHRIVNKIQRTFL